MSGRRLRVTLRCPGLPCESLAAPWRSSTFRVTAASVREDIARFRFLLGATDGEGVFTPDEP